MAEINVAPKLIKEITITVGTDSFSKHVNNCKYTPSSSKQEWRGGTPDSVFTDQTAATWELALTLIQDWESATSLCNFLLAHAGETAKIVYKPIAGGKVSFESNVIIVAPEIGGAVGTFNESTVTMGSDKPVLKRAP